MEGEKEKTARGAKLQLNRRAGLASEAVEVGFTAHILRATAATCETFVAREMSAIESKKLDAVACDALKYRRGSLERRRRKQDESKVKASVVEVEGEIQQKY